MNKFQSARSKYMHRTCSQSFFKYLDFAFGTYLRNCFQVLLYIYFIFFLCCIYAFSLYSQTEIYIYKTLKYTYVLTYLLNVVM